MSSIFFFDTYAMLEILKENPLFLPYASTDIITTKWNIFELFYHVNRELGEETARNVVDGYYPFIVGADKEIIIAAAKFRYLHKKKKLSMTDCIGYCVAMRHGIKFLTGDKEFYSIENVEYVK
jgi:uncharacterized protein